MTSDREMYNAGEDSLHPQWQHVSPWFCRSEDRDSFGRCRDAVETSAESKTQRCRRSLARSCVVSGAHLDARCCRHGRAANIYRYLRSKATTEPGCPTAQTTGTMRNADKRRRLPGSRPLAVRRSPKNHLPPRAPPNLLTACNSLAQPKNDPKAN